MPLQNIICISIDGLRASALGAYGNTWHPTPALDALASQSQVVDWMFCDRPTLNGFFDAAWGSDKCSLIPRLNSAGFQTALTTDDAAAAARAEASGFDEVRHLEFTAQRSADSVADTELAQLFAIAIDQLANWGDSAPESTPVARRLLWIHARGYRGAWDAPISFRASLLDDNDPSAPTFVAPPSQATVHDHDELLLFRAAYAAQTMVLDACLEALMAAMGEYQLDDSTMLLLTSPRAFALGEHGYVGADVGALFSELLHVPCLLRTPAHGGPGTRSSQLAQPADVAATVLEAAGLESAAPLPSRGVSLLSLAEPTPARSFALATGDSGERAIRTPAWMLRQPPAGDGASEAAANAELYLKPDDRWEANEISSRMPAVVDRLLAILSQCPDASAGHTIALDDDLILHNQ